MPDDENMPAMTIEEMQAFGEATKDAADKIDGMASGLRGLNSIGSMTNLFFETAKTQIQGFRDVMGDTTKMTENHAAALGALAAGLLTTKKAFEFEDLDTSGLSTLEGNIGEIVQTLVAAGAPISLFETLVSDTFGKTLPNGAKKSAEAAGSFIMQLARGSDNAARLQNAVMKLAASTGDLDVVYNVAGNDLTNINDILAMHNRIISDTSMSTGILTETVQKYYMELGKVPGTLREVVKSSKEAGGNVSMLAATMQLAAGSGRNFSEIVEDLQTAFTHYDMVGEDALQFTARMGELSNKYNVQLNVVRDSLRSTAEQLRMFGHDGEGSSRIMEGAAKIMNQYTQALKDTGISGAAAVGIIGDITKQISGMDVASRSFVSAQTGGAGGLRGAFQIENLMREGKIDEVMEKVRQSMTQQFGKIVSVEEAAGSERAAAMLVKQRMMLQQGPLGNLVQNEQQAGRLLEAFRTKEKGATTEALDSRVVQTNMERGVNFQQQNLTQISHIRSSVDAIKSMAALSTRGAMGQLGVYARGTTERMPQAPAAAEAQEMMRKRASGAVARGGETANRLAGVYTGEVMPNINEALEGWRESIEATKGSISEIPNALKAPISEIQSFIQSGKAEERKGSLANEIEQYRAQMRAVKDESRRQAIQNNIDQRQSEMETIDRWSGTMSRFATPEETTKAPVQTGPQPWLTDEMRRKGEIETPPTAPQQVGAAAAKAAPVVAEGAEAKAANAATPAGTAEPQRVAGTIEVRVVVEGEDGSVRKEQRESISVGTRGA